MSALLEVLDPAQNHGFTDTYLGLPFDLSGVVFVATANEEGNIPGPLRDRMEIIRISGYTLEERVAIAQQHLLPRVLTAHGLTSEMVAFDGVALQSLAMRYTREAGVRDLSRKLAAVCRHVALQIAMQAEGGAVPLTSPTDSSATAVPTAATDR
jgi:ATP-dependent Lon protease